jgi:hypothetical protein
MRRGSTRSGTWPTSNPESDPAGPTSNTQSVTPVIWSRRRSRPLRIPRLTIRRLMIVVAVASLAVAIEAGRRETYFGLASMHCAQWGHYTDLGRKYGADARPHRTEAARARVSLNAFFDWPRAKTEDTLANQLEADSRACLQLAAYHFRMVLKYREAARLPYRRIDPDPPSPAEPKGSRSHEPDPRSGQARADRLSSSE